jgi:hypothetical protein
MREASVLLDLQCILLAFFGGLRRHGGEKDLHNVQAKPPWFP